jgi:glutathione synthase/RimK-type ligase-like ATP-grasp enzyme
VPVKPTKPVEFHPYPEISAAAVEGGRKIVRAAGIDVGGIELIETPAGPVFYDINANSNLRAPIGQAFGFDPFERVADYLIAQIELNRRRS